MRVNAVADSSGGLFVETADELARISQFKESGLGIREFARGRDVQEPGEFVKLLRSRGVAVLVESLPTNIKNGQPGLDLIRTALENGISVVTVDKGPLVHGFDLLMEAARQGGSMLRFSGTTGVVPPDEITGEGVVEIRGVLNGTTNYVLDEMRERSISFEDALAAAQEAGIAEPDPSLDVEGWDTACKTLILAKTSMRAKTRLEEISRIGIGGETESLVQTARARGLAVRLVGRARIWQGRVRVSVAPKLIQPDSPFFSISGSSKLAVFRAESGREFISRGASSRNSIAELIHRDIIECIS